MLQITRKLTAKAQSKAMSVPKTWWQTNELTDGVVCSTSKKAPLIMVLSNHLTKLELRNQLRYFLQDKDFNGL